MPQSVRTTTWTNSWGGNLFMFRSEANGHHENQEVCLKLSPPHITAGEMAQARLETIDPYRPHGHFRGPAWRLIYGNMQLGAADSYALPVSFRIDQPGNKQIIATIGRVGYDSQVIARTELVVHERVDGEIDSLVRNLDEFAARIWFGKILDRHHEDAYRDQLDQILSRYLAGEPEKIQKTAFSLLFMLHEPTLQKSGTRYFRRDINLLNDAIQEAMRKAWRSIGGFRAETRFGPWIYKIFLNVCKDAKKPQAISIGTIDLESIRPGAPIDEIDAKDQFDDLARRHSPETIDPVFLKHGQGMSYLDVARKLGIQEGSPDATRITSARRMIKEAERILRADGSDVDADEKGGLHV